MAGSSQAVKHDGRIATSLAMLKADGDHYSAHDAEFSAQTAVAASSRNI
jgi:hypothetical protein